MIEEELDLRAVLARSQAPRTPAEQEHLDWHLAFGEHRCDCAPSVRPDICAAHCRPSQGDYCGGPCLDSLDATADDEGCVMTEDLMPRTDTCPIGPLHLHTYNHERSECIWCGPHNLAWKPGVWVDNGDGTSSWSVVLPTAWESAPLFYVDATTGERCPTMGNRLCTVTDSDHRHKDGRND
jgi:hypothetical protein